MTAFETPLDYTLLYNRVSAILTANNIRIGQFSLGIEFPDALDKLLYEIIGEETPKDKHSNVLYPYVPAKYGWLWGPNWQALLHLRLIQLGYLKS